ncbi:MAG TPA: GH92 family glycosyl hydrolase [Flavobacteriales bacterium]|nr:GH92 family glycosyl hydrolase [Flavobacteriales bacterium]
MTVLLLCAALGCDQTPPIAVDTTSPAVELVNPFIGTGGHGHTFPGACVPNGLVQLSPDTRPEGYLDWDGCSGYHNSDSLIYGFSHTHLSGTGVADLCDVLLMPMVDKLDLDPAKYRSPFRKSTEHAHAGYYTVQLDGPEVRAELTATQRTGVHRYTFPPEVSARLVLDLVHRDKLIAGYAEPINAREIVGERRSSSWARDQHLFFCIRFSHPMRSGEHGFFWNSLSNDTVAPLRRAQKAVVNFGKLDAPLVVTVGISAVSIEGARKNLEAEVPDQDFDAVRKRAEAAWNTKLNKIQVSGGTAAQRRTFYSALYHSYVAPYIFNDVDGQYRGMDGQVHHADHNVYTVFSLWDTFRALHPLMAVLEPDMTRDMVRTFLLHYQQGGRLPVWELWGNETDCMIGYHSVSVIADAYLKGIRGFDEKLALEAMLASADADHFGLDAYRKRGYISSEDAPESVSRTLEYAYDDWCIARFAEATGHADVAERFLVRSRNWQNLLDPDTKFFRARRNGGFVEPFDPYEVNFHYTEANAWQYSLFVPHDMDRFIQLLGGTTGFTRRLDALFEARTTTTGRDQVDIAGLIGQYAHGNEPSHSFAYLYTRSSTPDLTAPYVSRIMNDLYHDAPDGLSGNEDCGQMSAWYVWSALGLYPALPGSPELVFGIPLFDSAAVALPNGKFLRINSFASGNSRTHVERLTWNGQERPITATLGHAELTNGGTLRFELGPRAVDQPIAVPSDEVRMLPPPVPIIQAPRAAFTDSMTVAISAIPGPWEVHCAAGDALLGPCPPRMTLHEAGRITAVAKALAGGTGPDVTATFTRVESGRTIALESAYAPQYAAGGQGALVDGLRGGNDYRTGEWQGYHGVDLLATVDLGTVKRLKRAGLSVLQDQRSWIWYPKEVTFAWSTNGRTWSSTTVLNAVDPRTEGVLTTEMWSEAIGKKARYVKVIAKSVGPCPDWHQGKGGETWIFADEVLLETE